MAATKKPKSKKKKSTLGSMIKKQHSKDMAALRKKIAAAKKKHAAQIRKLKKQVATHKKQAAAHMKRAAAHKKQVVALKLKGKTTGKKKTKRKTAKSK